MDHALGLPRILAHCSSEPFLLPLGLLASKTCPSPRTTVNRDLGSLSAKDANHKFIQ